MHILFKAILSPPILPILYKYFWRSDLQEFYPRKVHAYSLECDLFLPSFEQFNIKIVGEINSESFVTL